MSKSVKFKNATNRPNKRVRLTHDSNATVDTGLQSGAIYYVDPELGMCYSKPMEITCVNKEETQCVSLLGLYDVFINGTRVGRNLTQAEILERVNAGDYGVEAVSCANVSCDGAPSRSNCFNIEGKWDVEINDIRIVENADEARILNVLSENPWIIAEPCGIACTPSGAWTFSIGDQELPSFEVGSSMRIITRWEHATETLYRNLVLNFNRNNIIGVDELTYSQTTFVTRDYSSLPWTLEEVMPFFKAWLNGSDGISVNENPVGYSDGQLRYCVDSLIDASNILTVANIAALDQSTYTYNDDTVLDFSNLEPTAKMILKTGVVDSNNDIVYGDPINIQPFTWDPQAQSAEDAELLLLNHFKDQLEPYGIVGEIVESERSVIPPSFPGGPATSYHDLILRSDYPFALTVSQQWDGSINHSENVNTDYGWVRNLTGLITFGSNVNAGSSTSTISGCKIGLKTPSDVNYSITYTGLTSTSPEVINNAAAKYTADSIRVTILSAESEGVTLADNQIDFATIFPTAAGEDNSIFTCGTYQIQ